MAHLSARASFALVIEVKVHPRLPNIFRPAIDIGADQIFHGRTRRHQRRIAQRKPENGAEMLFVDLNDLKLLNDQYGHMGGDAALMRVAEKLLQGTRANDCVARLGGDEFCVLLDHADEKSALETAERLVDSIACDDCIFEGVALPLSVAIGVTLIEKGDTPATVLSRADKAMYRVKAAA